ncbi:MAG: NAD(P)-dependent oxidoreductase [Arenicella sp.]
MTIGFIGLGNMGSGMATNLLAWCQEQGHRFIVFDINSSALTPLLEQGAETTQTVAELACQVEVLFTSLPGATQINQLSLGDDGLLKHLPFGSIWFETSTNELEQWQMVKAQAPEGLTLVDAPVTGGAEGAIAGTLTMLLGIDEPVLMKYESMLASFTQKAIRMGPADSGYVSKLCQLHLNYLVAQGIGEALMLGAKGNLDLKALHEVLQNSCAQSYVVDSYIPKVLDGSYDPSFSLGLAAKDMRLITELGKHLGVELVLADKVYETYQLATETFGDAAPHLNIIKLLEEKCQRLLR